MKKEDIDRIREEIHLAVPEALFAETDYGFSLRVTVPGTKREWIISQAFRRAYSGFQLLTEMGTADVIKSLREDLDVRC